MRACVLLKFKKRRRKVYQPIIAIIHHQPKQEQHTILSPKSHTHHTLATHPHHPPPSGGGRWPAVEGLPREALAPHRRPDGKPTDPHSDKNRPPGHGAAPACASSLCRCSPAARVSHYLFIIIAQPSNVYIEPLGRAAETDRHALVAVDLR